MADILLVEQNAEMALSIADRACVMETWRITLSGTGKEAAAAVDAETIFVDKAYQISYKYINGKKIYN